MCIEVLYLVFLRIETVILYAFLKLSVLNPKDTNSMKKLLALSFLLVVLASCGEDTQTPPEIAKIVLDLKVDRFDQQFAQATPEDLYELKTTYPYLFSKRYPDAYWVQKFQDTIQLEINEEVAKAFPNFDAETADLEQLFRHITYYFPKVPVPKVITITSEVDYRNKVVLADSLLIIGLDTYLGADHHFYTGIPKFQSKNFRREQLDVDVAAAFAKAYTPTPKNATFLAQMIYEGKKLYLLKRLLSEKEEHEIFGYTAPELAFAQENEVNVWEFFVKNELLYDTDPKLLNRFLEPAPFSKFYLAFDNETPGRIGRYIGYQIVKSYVEKNEIPFKKMLLQDAETIFANAKYKP